MYFYISDYFLSKTIFVKNRYLGSGLPSCEFESHKWRNSEFEIIVTSQINVIGIPTYENFFYDQ